MRKRLGHFYISRTLVDENPEALMKHVFSRVVIVRAEMLYDVDAIHYTAISTDFDELEVGSSVPTYEIMITSGANGELEEVKFVKLQ